MALANVTDAEQYAYLKRMFGYAKTAEAKTGIPAELIAAFWSWETHFGTNQTAKHNNHGGIKANSSGRDYVAGQYAGYNSISSFANDWARILNLNFAGYPAVISAARSGASWETIVRKFNDSSYAEADYNVSTIIKRANRLRGSSGGGVKVPEIDDSNRDQYAKLGAAMVGIIGAALLLGGD